MQERSRNGLYYVIWFHVLYKKTCKICKQSSPGLQCSYKATDIQAGRALFFSRTECRPQNHTIISLSLKVNFLMPGVENLFFLLNEGLSALLVWSTVGILARIVIRDLVF